MGLIFGKGITEDGFIVGLFQTRDFTSMYSVTELVFSIPGGHSGIN